MRPGSSGDQRAGRRTFGCAASAVVATPRRPNLLEGSCSPSKSARGTQAASLLEGSYSPCKSAREAGAGSLRLAASGVAGAAELSWRSGPLAGKSAREVPGRSRAGCASMPETPRGRNSVSLVGAMKGLPELDQQARHAPAHSDGEESDTQSVCSTSTQLSNLSTTASSRMGGSKHSSGSSSRSNRSIHVSVSSDCSIDIEQQDSMDRSKMSLCADFRQLCGEGSFGDGMMQALQMYGYQTPNKLQQHAIPAILHFMGRELGGTVGTTGKGKSCIIVQGPAQSGKTSAVVLSLLASLDLSLPRPQAILLSASPKRDIDKLLNVFTLMQPVTYQSFAEDDIDASDPLDSTSPKVRAARTAQVLIGHPRHMLKLLSSASALCLDSVRALVLDDAEELLYVVPTASSPSQLDETLEVETQKRNVLTSPQNQAAGQTLSSMPSCPPLIDDVISICNVLECRQFSQNMSDTSRIRSGQESFTRLRYMILSAQLKDQASRKVLRLLKNSLMKKKNLLSFLSPPPSQIIKVMRHYYAEVPCTDWVRVFSGLVQSLMLPRALIFCDDGGIDDYARQMRDMGISVSVNLPETAAGASETRRHAVQEFTSNKTQFLLTRSEPALCQITLPKVSCVFHFGIPPQLQSVYGVRLLPIDASAAKDATSILFAAPPKDRTEQKLPLARGIGKLFDIDFLDMPFEFLPAQPATGGHRRRA